MVNPLPCVRASEFLLPVMCVPTFFSFCMDICLFCTLTLPQSRGGSFATLGNSKDNAFFCSNETLTEQITVIGWVAESIRRGKMAYIYEQKTVSNVYFFCSWDLTGKGLQSALSALKIVRLLMHASQNSVCGLLTIVEFE